MLTEAQRGRIDVVLVSPRNPLNIGAAARAMANFGFPRLSVVAAYAPHWREARSAIGAPGLLQDARECPTLAEAVADSTFVIGTGTLTRRTPEQPVVSLPDLAPFVVNEVERGGRVCLVFGPEKHGLTREDLSWCHRLVEIPTDPRQPTMNLGQAVAVCLYELACRTSPPRLQAAALSTDRQEPPTASEDGLAPTSSHLDILAQLVEQTMAAAGYTPRSMEAANQHDLRLLLRRLSLSEFDKKRILGLFRRILWRLGRDGSRVEGGGAQCPTEPK